MCDKCLEKFAQMDPKLVSLMNETYPLYNDFINRFVEKLSKLKANPVQFKSLDMETGDINDELPDDLTEEDKAEVMFIRNQMSRASAGMYLATYAAFRANRDPETDMIMTSILPAFSNAGATMGHICGVVDEMKTDKPN